MKRHTITAGARTSAGGIVLEGSCAGSINGHRIALEGDAVSCPACKLNGVIRCIDPRLTELWNGKKVGLEKDLCVCGCKPSPTLIANQTLRYQDIGPPESERVDQHATGLPQRERCSQADTNGGYDDRYALVDDETGVPIAHREYAIQRASGSVEHGVTDAEGRTHLVSAMASCEAISIFVGEAP